MGLSSFRFIPVNSCRFPNHTPNSPQMKTCRAPPRSWRLQAGEIRSTCAQTLSARVFQLLHTTRVLHHAYATRGPKAAQSGRDHGHLCFGSRKTLCWLWGVKGALPDLKDACAEPWLLFPTALFARSTNEAERLRMVPKQCKRCWYRGLMCIDFA